MSLVRSLSLCFTALLALSACSSSTDSTGTPAETADAEADVALDTSTATDSGEQSETTTTDGASESAPDDGCDTTLCDRFGYVCDGNTQVGCGPTAPGSCYVPITKKTCPADAPCTPATGTCGGCDASDLCAGKADGEFLVSAPYTAQWCRKGPDGCPKMEKETCGIACVGGARQGCCGGEGQMCCSPPGAACATGLSCKSEKCAK